jgi:protocatechuate 4,5-dioxygenase, beta chain
MAYLIGGVFTSHVPAIGGAIARGVEHEPYWKPFFDGFVPVRTWLQAARPDVAVVFYNDHGLNFFLDKMPTFALGVAQRYANADEGWGIPQVAPFSGHEALSWHLLEQLVAADFDIVSCQEMQVDHAFTLPFQLLWPDGSRPVTVVPVCINTVLFPLPSAARCLALGRRIGQALQEWPGQERVLVIGSGGLSHQLEGQRAGHLNPAFDQAFMDSLSTDEAWATQFSINDLAREAGTQGLELLNWLAARGALAPAGAAVQERHRNYHIPISNTASGLMLLEPAAA